MEDMIVTHNVPFEILYPFEEAVRLRIASKEQNQHSHPSTLLPTDLVNF